MVRKPFGVIKNQIKMKQKTDRNRKYSTTNHGVGDGLCGAVVNLHLNQDLVFYSDDIFKCHDTRLVVLTQ